MTSQIRADQDSFYRKSIVEAIRRLRSIFPLMIQPGGDELTEATTQQLCHIRSPGFVSKVPRIGQLAEFVRIFVRVESEAGIFPN